MMHKPHYLYLQKSGRLETQGHKPESPTFWHKLSPILSQSTHKKTETCKLTPDVADVRRNVVFSQYPNS